jgi:hypothetical protein
MCAHPHEFLFGRVMRSPLQQKKSTTKCPPRDFRRRSRRDTARTSSLPRMDSRARQEQAQNGDKIGAIKQQK